MQNEKTDRIDLIPKDTTLEAYRFQVQVWRRMGPEGRLRAAFEASDNLRELVASGVRLRYPNYSEEQVKLAVTRLMVGDEVFRKFLPGIKIEP